MFSFQCIFFLVCDILVIWCIDVFHFLTSVDYVNKFIILSIFCGCTFSLAVANGYSLINSTGIKTGHIIISTLAIHSCKYHLIGRKGFVKNWKELEEEIITATFFNQIAGILATMYCLFIFIQTFGLFNTKEWSLPLFWCGIGMLSFLAADDKFTRDTIFMGRHFGSLNIYALLHSIGHIIAYYIIALATNHDTCIIYHKIMDE